MKIYEGTLKLYYEYLSECIALLYWVLYCIVLYCIVQSTLIYILFLENGLYKKNILLSYYYNEIIIS